MNDFYTIVLAPNPSLLTGPGTNTVVLGEGDSVMVIDPGVPHPGHLQAIAQEVERRGRLSHIFVTHRHPDHVGGSAELKTLLGGSIIAYEREGNPQADEIWTPDWSFPVQGDQLRAIYTPGHRYDHLVLYAEARQLLFASDMISTINTVVIIPGEGNMFDYMKSLDILSTLRVKELVPGHGAVEREKPEELIRTFKEHRRMREAQLLEVLKKQSTWSTISVLVKIIYIHVEPALHIWAEHSVEAHLLKLLQEQRVERNTYGEYRLLQN